MTQSAMLKVPGAAIYHETIGAGRAHRQGQRTGPCFRYQRWRADRLQSRRAPPRQRRYPVAHESPTTALLPDPTAARAADQALYDTYKNHGVEAAMGQFFAENGLEDAEGAPDYEMPPEEAETFGRVMGNFEYWLAHGMLPLSNYQPDVAALRTEKPRIVVALGEQSAGQPIAEMTSAAAAALGIAPVTLPGDHMGFGPQAEAFAKTLDQTLSKP